MLPDPRTATFPALILCTFLGLVPISSRADETPPPGNALDGTRLAIQIAVLTNEGSRFEDEGKYAAAIDRMRQALRLRQQLYPPSHYPAGHLQVALGFDNLAEALKLGGQLKEAQTVYESAIAMFERLFPAGAASGGHVSYAECLADFGNTLYLMGDNRRAQPILERAVAMSRRLNDRDSLRRGLNYLALLFEDRGDLGRAELQFEEALAVARELYPESRFPNGHRSLIVAFSNMAWILQNMGDLPRASAYFDQALQAARRFYSPRAYPAGHRTLAAIEHRVGCFHALLGQHEQAIPRLEAALVMSRRWYPEAEFPNGHHELVLLLNDLGLAHQSNHDFGRASRAHEEALTMARKLYPRARYPDGHHQVAIAAYNLGICLDQTRQLARAQALYEEARTIWKKLDGEDGTTSGNRRLLMVERALGNNAIRQGLNDKAFDHFQRALNVSATQLERTAPYLGEREALLLTAELVRMRDSFLRLARGRTDPDGTYRAVWIAKGAVTRVLEQRYAVARSAGPEVAARIDDLRAARRRLETLVLQPTPDANEQRQRLAEATESLRHAERDLARSLPRDSPAIGVPNDLHRTLPEQAAFIDLIQYQSMDHDDQTRSRYAAFILTRGQAIRHLDLGEAAPLDEALDSWRKSLGDPSERDRAAVLGRLLGRELLAAIPRGTKTLFISPAGNLARVAWAALPNPRTRSILLEEFAIATVPHGPFLRDQLMRSVNSRKPESVLALGDVRHGPPWPALPGTRVEIRAIEAVAPYRVVALTGSAATRAQVTRVLPEVGFAHLASHGAFDEKGLASQLARERVALASGQAGIKNAAGVGLANPLAFVGLVLAEGETLTGLALIDLQLQGLNLVTLSACETGLGALTGGEGVQGLQRAFHLAGCPNVVASLWKVNDAATAALMAKFYHELWVNKKPPIEALREAQLTIYYHPELIPDLAGERGAPKLKEAVAVRATPRAANAAKRADTKLWAAFMLSGVGK